MTTKAYPQTSRPRYGMRRADGRPWRSEPRESGDVNYYSLSPAGTTDGELTEDGMVFICYDVYDLLSCVLSQFDGEPIPDPGEAIPMRVEYASGEHIFVDMSDYEFEALYVGYVARPGDWLVSTMGKWRQARSASA